MPFITLLAQSSDNFFYPTDIDAYHAWKIKKISFIITNGSGGALTEIISMGFDEIADITWISGDVKSLINAQVSLAANDTFFFEVDNIDKIVGDFITLITSAAAMKAGAIIFYDLIKTSFDQYGQVAKTFKRCLVK